MSNIFKLVTSQLPDLSAITGKELITVHVNDQIYKLPINKLPDMDFTKLTKCDIELCNVDNTSDLNKPMTDEVRSTLSNKSDIGHEHTISSITGLETELQSKVTTHTLNTSLQTKSNINHQHLIQDVTGLELTLAQLVTTSQMVNALSGKTNISHTHQINDVANLTAVLNTKADLAHTHQINDVANLTAVLNTKADLAHTHQINDVANLTAELNNKSNIDHTHPEVISLKGPEVIPEGINSLFIITNYDMRTDYNISVTNGTFFREIDELWIKPNEGVTRLTININEKITTILVRSMVINTPSIIHPTANTAGIQINPVIISSRFSTSPEVDNLVRSEWMLSTDPLFINDVVYLNSTSEVVTLDTLQPNTTYFIKVRHVGMANILSEWSSVITFATINNSQAPGCVYIDVAITNNVDINGVEGSGFSRLKNHAKISGDGNAIITMYVNESSRKVAIILYKYINYTWQIVYEYILNNIGSNFNENKLDINYNGSVFVVARMQGYSQPNSLFIESVVAPNSYTVYPLRHNDYDLNLVDVALFTNETNNHIKVVGIHKDVHNKLTIFLFEYNEDRGFIYPLVTSFTQTQYDSDFGVNTTMTPDGNFALIAASTLRGKQHCNVWSVQGNRPPTIMYSLELPETPGTFRVTGAIKQNIKTGSRLFIGRPDYSVDDSHYLGVVYVFKFNGVTWSIEDIIKPLNATAFRWFGTNIDPSADGLSVLISSGSGTHNLSPMTSEVYTFHDGKWSFCTKLTATDPSILASGYSVWSDDTKRIFTYIDNTSRGIIYNKVSS